MKKWSTFVMAIFIAIFFSGCSFYNFEMSNLMHPPKATGEMAQIQSLIEKTVGADIIFKYPQNGDYRSAIILHDIDADGQDEAVAVYQLDPQETQAYIIIIDKVDDRWEVKKTIASQNTDLDKVCFGDVTGNGRDDIILGWSSYINYGKEFTVILSEESDYEVIYPKEHHSDLVVGDFDDDGQAEVLAVSLSRREDTVGESASERSARANLLKFMTNTHSFQSMGVTLMDSTVIKYNGIKFGGIDAQQKGAVIDGTTNKDKITTEIVYWDKAARQLLAPLYDAQTFSADKFLRDSVIQSSDLNRDGIIEIPRVELRQDGASVSTVYVLGWYRYNTATRTPEYINSIVMNDADSYIFVVPSNWKGNALGEYKILLGYDRDNRTMSVYERIELGGQVTRGREVLNIAVFSAKEYNDIPESEKSGDIVLDNTPQRAYIAYATGEGFELSLSEKDIKNSFKVV